MKQKPTKKKVSVKKLSLKKETIADLKIDKMNEVRGGSMASNCWGTCVGANCHEPW